MCKDNFDALVNDENQQDGDTSTADGVKRRGLAIALASAMLLGLLALVGAAQAAAIPDDGNRGDGYWSADEEYVPPTLTPCTDPDGDGWGWNGFETCEMDGHDQVVSDETDYYDYWAGEGHPDTYAGEIRTITIVCVDTDGDGWGWAEYEGEGYSCQGPYHYISMEPNHGGFGRG